MDALSKLGGAFKSIREGTFDQPEDSKFNPSVKAPNAIEWVTNPIYLNKPSLFFHVRQYQVIRDFFQLRCPICNSRNPDHIDCWGKGREYLESEILLVWDKTYGDDICPKCKNMRTEFVSDGLLHKYNTMIGVAGMRSGKSVCAGQIATYIEHVIITIGAKGRGELQRACGQIATQTFEVGFAATTATQTEATVYDVFRELRAESPWIRNYVDWVKEKEENQIVIRGMQKWSYKELDTVVEDEYLRVRYESLNKNSAGLAGRTRIGIIIDELARFGTTDSPMGAHEVWQVLHNSLKTLRKSAEKNPRLPWWLGIALSTSSPISVNDKQMQLLSNADKVTNMFAFHYATWEFHPDFIREDFDEDYALDSVLAERDFGANPPAAMNPLVEDPKRIWLAIDPNLTPTVTFTKITPQDKTGREYVGLAVENAMVDRRFDRFIRVDAGKSFDAFAMACAHGEWVSNVKSLTEESLRDMDHQQYEKMMADGIQYSDEDGYYTGSNEDRQSGYFVQNPMFRMKPHERADTVYVTVFDWIVRILPEQEPKRPVWFESVTSIVRRLSKFFNISQALFDHWNSESSIQTIREMGIEARVESIKADDFVKFKNDAYSGKIKLLPPMSYDGLDVDDNGSIMMSKKMSQMSGQGCALLEFLKLERSIDLKRVFNSKKGKVSGENSDDLAQVMVGVHRQVQSFVNAEKNTKIDNLKRSKVGGQGWARRGGVFRLSRWS